MTTTSTCYGSAYASRAPLRIIRRRTPLNPPLITFTATSLIDLRLVLRVSLLARFSALRIALWSALRMPLPILPTQRCPPPLSRHYGLRMPSYSPYAPSLYILWMPLRTRFMWLLPHSLADDAMCAAVVPPGSCRCMTRDQRMLPTPCTTKAGADHSSVIEHRPSLASSIAPNATPRL